LRVCGATGLTTAGRDNSHSRFETGPPGIVRRNTSIHEIGMSARTPDDIEIGYSSLGLLRLVGLGVLMTLLSASIAFNWYADKGIDGFLVVIGYAGVAFFGFATLKLIWTLITAKGPVVFISRYGIRDQRIVRELMPWDQIEDISSHEYRRQKFVVLKISPALENRIFATKAEKARLLANRMLGVDGIAITASGLTIDADTLLKTCQACYSDAKPVHQPAGA
jgi:hypothetical protein